MVGAIAGWREGRNQQCISRIDFTDRWKAKIISNTNFFQVFGRAGGTVKFKSSDKNGGIQLTVVHSEISNCIIQSFSSKDFVH